MMTANHLNISKYICLQDISRNKQNAVIRHKNSKNPQINYKQYTTSIMHAELTHCHITSIQAINIRSILNTVTYRVFWTPQSLLVNIQYSNIALQQHSSIT